MSEQPLDKFIETVMNDASQQKNKLIREIEIEKKRQIDNQEEKILQAIYLDIQKQISQIQNNASRLISKTSFDSKRDLLLKREELTNEVFILLSKKLTDYSKTKKYQEKVIFSIEELFKQYDKSNSVLFLNDYDYTNLLPKLKLNKNIQVSKDINIVFGGFIFEIPELNIQHNETLDLKLEQQKSIFNEFSGLSIS